MNGREEARKLYEGKYFYEVVPKNEPSTHTTLIGPLDNVLYTNPSPMKDGTAFVQVINGKIVAAFKEEEILVTTRLL